MPAMPRFGPSVGGDGVIAFHPDSRDEPPQWGLGPNEASTAMELRMACAL